MVKKHLPMLRTPEFELGVAADHLEQWVNDDLPPDLFLDVSAFLDSSTKGFYFQGLILVLIYSDNFNFGTCSLAVVKQTAQRFEVLQPGASSSMASKWAPQSLVQRENIVKPLVLFQQILL